MARTARLTEMSGRFALCQQAERDECRYSVGFLPFHLLIQFKVPVHGAIYSGPSTSAKLLWKTPSQTHPEVSHLGGSKSSQDSEY